MGGNDKKKKGYYQKCARGGRKGSYQQALATGMRGFLITCSNRAEKDAARDAYKILNEYADELYGPEFKEQEVEPASESEEDIEKALQKEVKDIKSKKDVPRRFSAVEAGANGCIFIKTSVEKPEELLLQIVTDLDKTKVSKSRFIMKIFPVVMTCRADKEKIKAAAMECLPEVFKGLQMFSYEIVIKVRNSSGLSKTSILPLFNEVFTELGLPGKVKFGSADYVISVDVLKSVCCISVLREFNRFKKYNLHEIAMGGKSDITPPDKSATKRLHDPEDGLDSKHPKRRNSGEATASASAVKEEVKPSPQDPLMTKLAGLIQTKVANTPPIKVEKTPDMDANKEAEVMVSEEKNEGENGQEKSEEDKKPEVLSLGCPYVASSI